MYITEDEIQGTWAVNYRVGNRTDETLTNVMVKIKAEAPHNDGSTPGDDAYIDDDDIMYVNWVFTIFPNSDGYGEVKYERPDANDQNTYAGHWLMPTIRPFASHSVETNISTGAIVNEIRIRRNTATMTQLAADGTELCKTERVYWTRGYGPRIAILDTRYGVALSADERHPKVYDNRNSDTVNFKVRVNVKHGYGVNARVTYTSGLAPLKTPTVTPPAKTTWQYHATKRQGDFFIGTEDVGGGDFQNYEITLPMQVKQGATVSEQCVTVTVTGVAWDHPAGLGPHRATTRRTTGGRRAWAGRRCFKRTAQSWPCGRCIRA